MEAVDSRYLYPHPDWAELISSESPVFLDVGANDGGTSFALSKIFPLARIFAFECDPRAIARFLIRLEQNPDFANQTTLIQKAVSSSVGVREFFCSDGYNPNLAWYDSGWDLSGSLKQPLSSSHTGLETVVFQRSIEVPVTSLDAYIKERGFFCGGDPVIDLLWIDVQGAELDVFKGARNLLKNTRFIHCECMNTKVYSGQPRANEILEELGSEFKLIASYENDLLFLSNSIP